MLLNKNLSNNSNNNIHNNIHNSDNDNDTYNDTIKQMKGGLFSSFGKSSFFKTISKTKKSESSLISSYEEMDKKIMKYQKSYETHLENLEKLDDYANFNGMKTLFKDIIMKDIINTGQIDKNNPLLFRNYDLEDDEIVPSSFRKEHILSQVRFIQENSFAERDNMLIRKIEVHNITKDDFILYIMNTENIKTKSDIKHKNYIIDKKDTKKFLEQVILKTKKELNVPVSIIKFENKNNENNDDNSDSKTHNSNSNSNSKKKSKKTKRTMKTMKSKKNMSNKRSRISKKSINYNNLFKKTIKKSKKNNLNVNKDKSRIVFDFQLTNHEIKEKEKKKAEKAAAAKAAANEEARKKAAEDKAALDAQYRQGKPVPGLDQPLKNCGIHTDFQTCKNAGCWFNNNICMERGAVAPAANPYAPAANPYVPPANPYAPAANPFAPTVNTKSLELEDKEDKEEQEEEKEDQEEEQEIDLINI